LDEARAIPQQQESDLPARALVVEPSVELHVLPHVLAEIFDVDASHVNGRIRYNRKNMGDFFKNTKK
jgi:hypothetical protein